MKINLLVLSLLALFSRAALADVVYVTARPSPCTVTANCPGANPDGTYAETNFPTLGDFGAVGSAPGHPQTTVARTYISSALYTNTEGGVDLTPTLGVAGGTYKIDYNFNSTAGNTSTNIVMAVNAVNGVLSFSSTDKLQRQYGSPANQWQTMGYLTNNVGSTTPRIQFRYQSGMVTGTAPGNRLLFDCWRFTLVEPCLSVASVNVTGPLGTNVNEVVVTGVTNATAVTVYQNSGSGMVQIGQKATGVTDGNNTVTVAGLVKGAIVAATQTVGGQPGCVPTLGTLVGGGANPRIRAAISIRETTDTGPVGAPATDLASVNIHFLGSSATVLGGTLNGPAGGTVIQPSNDWQTITFLRGTNEIVGDPANALGIPANGTGYTTNDSVSIQVYAYRTLPNAVKIFSANPATSLEVTSNDTFTVNWTWDAVPDAEGYRVLRNLNFASYIESVDVAVNNYNDANVGWTTNNITVTPTTSQSGRSVRWNPSLANTNNLPGQWGVVDSINFIIDDLTDTGPHDLYIDNLQNGTTTWQTFEEAALGANDVTFRRAGFSGVPSGHVLSAPDSSVVSNLAADNSTNSLRIRFQWVGTNSTRWVRLSTSTTIGAVPLVNLDDPISFRILLLPVGSSPAVPPGAISVALINGETVLNWTGTHQLQASSLVTGTYTNVPGITTAPWTNTFTEPQKFFRLAN